MLQFLTIALVLGVAAFFLYALSAVDNRSIDKKEKSREKRQREKDSMDPRKVYGKNWDPNLPKPRICPVCGKFLNKDEYLYASILEPASPGQKRQAHIYGCRYCYLGLLSEEEKSETDTHPTEELGL